MQQNCGATGASCGVLLGRNHPTPTVRAPAQDGKQDPDYPSNLLRGQGPPRSGANLSFLVALQELSKRRAALVTGGVDANTPVVCSELTDVKLHGAQFPLDGALQWFNSEGSHRG